MEDKITITTLNCQGLGDRIKRKDVLNYLKQKQFSIYFLQDTHFLEKEEQYIRSQWGYDCYFSSHSSQSRGVAIMLNPNFEHKITQVTKDKDGNKLILEIVFLGKKFTLINIYGPNRDKPNFYAQISKDIEELSNENIILAGDFNLILDFEADTQGYVTINNPRARDRVLDLCNEFSLIDIWREMNMENREFTWRKPNGTKKARLDFFLISETLFPQVMESKIISGYRTDHSLVVITLGVNKTKKNRTFWKFNNSLLKDPNYVSTIKEVIKNTKTQYIDKNQNEQNDVEIENIPNSVIKFTINEQLFLETLLMEIRGKTIAYSTFKKKQQDNKEKQLVTDIENMEKENDAEKHNLLQEKKAELLEIRKKKIEGLFIRSRAQWIDKGEKVTKYFSNLENRNYISKSMPNLIKDDGNKTIDDSEIIQETKHFYENLYAFRPTQNINIEKQLNFNDIPKLNEQQSESLEGLITIEEMLVSLKNMKNNKSPGSDGFTIEFYKFFWIDIGHFVVRSINSGFETGELSSTQKEGVITCIPKGNKNKQYIKNWRPISLLNVSYKLASACIANRLKKVLPFLIHNDQTGFITGRYIGENIRTLYDLLHYTEKHKIPGLLLLIDFEKAFDSVAWTFIRKTFNFFKFGNTIKKWIDIFYKNIKSCVIVNGEVSQWFNICRGCRQGDPLSPYIFILCAEILSLMLRKNKHIKGITIKNAEYLISQYADDTSITLDPTEETLRNTLIVLKFYARASGLCINFEKTRVIWFGSLKGSTTTLCPNYELSWDQGPFTFLGVKFTVNLGDMIKLNYKEKIIEIKKLLVQWSKRILTPFGKIVVIKSLAMAKINHLLLALPDPPTNILNELNALFFKFLWNGKQDRIKRKVVTKDYIKGGLKMLDVHCFVHALKLSWIRRIIKVDNSTKWFILLQANIPNVIQFLNLGVNFVKDLIKEVKNDFWIDVFKAWITFSKILEPEDNWADFLIQPLWCNDLTKVGGRSIFYKNWFEKGISHIIDLTDNNGQFLSFDDFSNRSGVKTNFLKYQGVIQMLKKLKDKCIEGKTTKIQRPFMTVPIKTVLMDNKGCQNIYKIYVNNNIMPTAQRKWQLKLNLHNEFKWSTVYLLLHKTTQDTHLKWFQTRILHRILATNTFLYKIGIADNELCNFCQIQPESLEHLFWECPISKIFWEELTEWIKRYCSHLVNPRLRKQDVLFGITNKTRTDKILNLILLLAKNHIYRMKSSNKTPHINNFKKDILFHYKSYKYIAKINCEHDNFDKEWQSYKTLIESIQSSQ